MNSLEFKSSLFNIRSDADFERVTLSVFKYQATENKVYKNYLEQLKVDAGTINALTEIPFLPVEFFRYFDVISGVESPKITFASSGTTGMEQSHHYVVDPLIYEKSFRKGFEHFYGDIKEYCILALLPSYLEREGSSLIYMVKDLIERSEHSRSGFYLDNVNELHQSLLQLKKEGKQKVLLLGVTYALLDFVEQHSILYPELIVMETGGMKGRRKEMVREELHQVLCKGFGVKHIHSEYGMTELLSQAYSKGEGLFQTPPWMRMLIRDTNDPASMLGVSQTGGINIIDLANIYSCSFIATQDLGRKYADGTFEVVGRFDNSDIRGCNLLVS